MPSFCDNLNISLCSFTTIHNYHFKTNTLFVDIIVTNTHAWSLPNTWVKIPISLKNLEQASEIMLVDAETESQIAWQVVPIDESIWRIPERRDQKTKANFHLFFNTITSIPGFGNLRFTLSYLTKNDRTTRHNWMQKTHFRMENNIAWGGPELNLKTNVMSFSRNPLLLKPLHSDENNPTRVFSFKFADDPNQNVYHFNAELRFYAGVQKRGNASGAYIFSPYRGSDPILRKNSLPTVKGYSGPLVQEDHLKFSEWAQLTIRYFQDQILEVDWIVGPLPDEMGYQGKEAIVRYWIEKEGDPFLKSEEKKGEFFVDSNGRRLIRRVNGHRIYWDVSVENESDLLEDHIAGNYYPVNSRALVKDLYNEYSFAVYTDRAQGMAMLKDGVLEFMLNRRCLKDDLYGVDEALMEDGSDGRGLVVKGTHSIRFDTNSVIENDDRLMASIVANKPILMFAKRNSTFIEAFQRKIMQSINTEIPLRRRYRASQNSRNIIRHRRNLKRNSSRREFLLNLFNVIPNYINLMTVNKWPIGKWDAEFLKTKQVLLRFEVFNTTNTPMCTTLVISNLFSNVKITQANEVTITANQNIQSARQNRLHWPGEMPDDTFDFCLKLNFSNVENSVEINLLKGEIQTFICDFE